MIEIIRLHKQYQLSDNSVAALNNINLKIAAGEFTAIAGPSGSGKTTLLNILGCIDAPSSGEVIFEGKNLVGLAEDELTHFRAQNLGFIFQNFNLFPVLTAAENVEYGLLHFEKSEKKRTKLALVALEMVGLQNHAHHRPNQLSGGQRQRVAIARAIAKKPKLILADEPTANLDQKTAHQIVSLLKELNLKEKITILFSTHDQHIIQHSRKVVNITDGSITSIKESPNA